MCFSHSLIDLSLRSIDTLNRGIGDLDTVVDKEKYLEFYNAIFIIPRRIKFEPHKGDEVSQVNAQVLIRDEMQSRFIQMQSRLAVLKTENDEVSEEEEIPISKLMDSRGKRSDEHRWFLTCADRTD